MPQLPNVIRASFFYKAWPVEVTTLDPETLERRIALTPQQGNCGSRR